MPNPRRILTPPQMMVHAKQNILGYIRRTSQPAAGGL